MQQEITIRFLGTGTIQSGPEQSCTSILLETPNGNILLDCGPGTLMRLRQTGMKPDDLRYVFLTHFHPDHIADLIPLIFVKVNQSPGSDRELSIWGPPGFARYMNGMLSAYGEWMKKPGYIWNELAESPMDFDFFRIKWLRVFHNEESIGYRFEFGRSTFAFSGDSGYCPELITLASGAHTAVLECAFPDDREVETHLTPEMAGEIARQAKPGRLLITHVYPETLEVQPENIIRKSFRGEVKLVRDLDYFTIPL